MIGYTNARWALAKADYEIIPVAGWMRASTASKTTDSDEGTIASTNIQGNITSGIYTINSFDKNAGILAIECEITKFGGVYWASIGFISPDIVPNLNFNVTYDGVSVAFANSKNDNFSESLKVGLDYSGVLENGLVTYLPIPTLVIGNKLCIWSDDTGTSYRFNDTEVLKTPTVISDPVRFFVGMAGTAMQIEKIKVVGKTAT